MPTTWNVELAAPRGARRLAADAYWTQVHGNPEVAVLNAYPMDTDLFQAGKALGVLKDLLRIRVVVLLAACPDGFGYHALCGPGGRFNQQEPNRVQEVLAGKRLIVCSENVKLHDVRKKFSSTAVLCRTWTEAVDAVEKNLGRRFVDALVFPAATIQMTSRAVQSVAATKPIGTRMQVMG